MIAYVGPDHDPARDEKTHGDRERTG
jgi:hypothetical protein